MAARVPITGSEQPHQAGDAQRLREQPRHRLRERLAALALPLDVGDLRAEAERATAAARAALRRDATRMGPMEKWVVPIRFTRDTPPAPPRPTAHTHTYMQRKQSYDKALSVDGAEYKRKKNARAIRIMKTRRQCVESLASGCDALFFPLHM